MAGRVIIRDHAIVASPYDLPILYDDRSKWAAITCGNALSGFIDGKLHKIGKRGCNISFRGRHAAIVAHPLRRLLYDDFGYRTYYG